MRSNGTKTAPDPEPFVLMIAFPNAKINLGLNILERRSDGFHNIESLLIPLKLSDILEVIPSDDLKVSFTSTGLEIPSNGKPNLCQQAFQEIKKQFSIPGVSIHLHKNIPSGSGLGGGSADAAFTLKMIDRLFSLNLSVDELKNLAAKLGSDCPFFIENQPVLVTGRGEKLESFPVDLSGLHLMLVIPNIRVSTADAYAGVQPSRPEVPLREVLKQPLEKWKDLLKNDFENSVFHKYPLLARIKKELYQAGALYASMSGSGSSLFGLFRKKPDPTLRQSFPDAFFWMETMA